MNRRRPVPRLPFAVAAVALALSGAAHADVLGGRASQLSSLSNSQAQALDAHLKGATKALAQKLNGSKDAVRSARQAPLGPPVSKASSLRKTALVGQGRWLAEIGDVANIPGVSPKQAQQAGAIWSAWTNESADVQPRPRPSVRRWNGPKGAPASFRLHRLPMDWRGLFRKTSTRGLENGHSRGHIVPNAEATRSRGEQLHTFQLYGNAFPQTRDSNAGVWRNLEKTLQLVSKTHTVVNYAGVIWTPHEYTRKDGSKARVEPEMLPGGIPKPTAHWKVSLIIPKKDANGRPLTLAQGLAQARPVAVVIPNAQDAELFVSDWDRFSTSTKSVERLTGLKFFSHLDSAPGGAAIAKALRNHVDTGQGLPREAKLPAWKVRQLKQLIRAQGPGISRIARRAAQALLKKLPHGTEPRRSNQARSSRARGGGRPASRRVAGVNHLRRRGKGHQRQRRSRPKKHKNPKRPKKNARRSRGR